MVAVHHKTSTSKFIYMYSNEKKLLNHQLYPSSLFVGLPTLLYSVVHRIRYPTGTVWQTVAVRPSKY